MGSTKLRAAAQQALEALQDFKRRGHWGDFDNLTGTLQAALVEDAMQKFTDVNQELEAALAEPVQPYDQTSLELCDTCGWRTLIPGDACLNCARLQKQEPVQEPVWVCPDSAEHRYQKPGHCEDCGKTLVQERNFCPRCGKRTNGIHTCTPPAPLTDEVIADLWHQNGGFHHHFARAIERWLKGNP